MKAIKTTYRGPTNFKGSRIIASDADGHRITLPYDHALNIDQLHVLAAQKLCDKMKWNGKRVVGWFGNDAFHVFTE